MSIISLINSIFLTALLLPAVASAECEIISVTAGQFQYQNGGTVPLSLLVKNVGEWEQNIQVNCKLYGCVDTITFPPDTLAIPPGETIQIQHFYDIPVVEYAQEYDAQVWIEDEGVQTISENFPDIFQSSSLTPLQIQQGQTSVSNCLPLGAECALAVGNMIPAVAFPFNVGTVVTGACNVQSKLELEKYTQAGTAGLISWYSAFSVLLEFVPAARSVEEMIPSAIGEAITCSSGLVALGSSGQAGGPVDADYLTREIQASLDSVGISFKNLIAVDGPVRLRVHHAGFFTDADTMGLKRTWVVAVDSTQYSWAHLGYDPVPVGQNTIYNPFNEIVAEFKATAAGEVDVSVLHNEGFGAPFQLEYEPFLVTETTVCWLEMADYSMDSGIRIDYDGDGVIDHVEHRVNQISGDEGGPNSWGINKLHDAYPNPFNPSTTIAYEVAIGAHIRLAIYDVGGRLVKVLVDEHVAASGRREVRWDGRDLSGRMAAAGVYFCRLAAGVSRETKRVVLVK